MKAESWELVRLFAGVLAVGAAVILAGSIQADARPAGAIASLGPLTLVSRGLPYHHGPCGRPGIANRDSAAEATITSDPRNPNRLLVAWFAAPDYDGLDHAGIIDLVSRSNDAGRHWQWLPLRGVSRCAGGRAPKDADPALAWGNDGFSYFISNPGGPVHGVPVARPVLFRFAPGGRPVQGPTLIPAPRGYNDRPTISVDPRRPSWVYAVWVFHEHASSSADTGGQNVVMFAVSHDHGQHWTTRRIYQAPTGEGIWGTQLFVARGRRFVVTYRKTGTTDWAIDALRSRDGGRTWTRPIRVAPLTPGVINASGLLMPIFVNDLSASGPRGAVYTAWSNNTADGRGQVLISHTDDGGRTWTRPTSITSGPCNAMLTTVALSGPTLGVSYYAFRQCKPGTAPLLDVWFAASNDHGAHWQTTRLAGPFDLRSVLDLTFLPGVHGEPPGRFLGDYTGLAATANGFGAIMILPRPYARYGQQDVFFRRINTH